MKKSSFSDNGFLKIFVLVLLIVATSVTFLYFFQFEDAVTPEDIYYAQNILHQFNVDTAKIHTSFAKELQFIASTQHAIQTLALSYEPIPMYHTRNLKDIYNFKSGLCYDKSHAIEKILQIHGFKTRHISIYYYEHWYEKLWIAFITNSYSHAVNEVKTQKGWMLVDSIDPVLGISANQMPLSLYKLRKLISLNQAPLEVTNHTSYTRKFIFFYGVYSRNGKLYPPYNFIPDYRLDELIYNMFFVQESCVSK